tara:strand:+ start:299 stop:691 length:393 start_codon:yes stop_codon:yes gene_type:complete
MISKEEIAFTDQMKKELSNSSEKAAEEMESSGLLSNLDNPLSLDPKDVPKEGYKLNRKERKRRIKHFMVFLKENEKQREEMIKEDANANSNESVAKLENRQARLQAWFVRRVNLERKIANLRDKDHIYGH